MAMMRSLRLRLFTLLLALAALVALAVGLATYRSVRAEADELFDYQLRQLALSLRDQGRIADDERASFSNPAFDYVVQIWSADGVALYSSHPAAQAQPLPPRTPLGLSNIRVGDATWRVYGVATPQRLIQVAQPLEVRRRLAATAAGRSVLPIVVAAPIVGLAMWWLVGLSMRPLQRVAAAARLREAGSVAPLPEAGLPSEVAPLVAEFNVLLSRLGAAFDAQRAFVADAAHELRTPLTALKLQIGLLRDADDEPQRAQALVRLRAGVDRAAHLVEQLLALARAEQDAPLRAAPIDLVDVARQALADAAPLAELRHAELGLDAPPALPLHGDAQALRSLLRNLIDNAVKHGGMAPRVRVSVEPVDGGALLRVDDNGPGIAAVERDKVFDRFHRREGTAADGSGLGLAIAQAIARRHGGQVQLGDSPLGGLRAEVRLRPATHVPAARAP